MVHSKWYQSTSDGGRSEWWRTVYCLAGKTTVAVSRGPGGFGSSFEAWLAWKSCLLLVQKALPLDIARVPLVWLMELLMGFYHKTHITYSSFSIVVVRNIIGTRISANTEIWSHTDFHRMIFNNPEAHRAEELTYSVLKAPPTKLQHFKDDTDFM